VADIAPLLGENRKLVTEGLAVMNSRPRPGVAALKQIAGMAMHRVTAETIGFGLGPRINAAGRLAHAYSAARLLAANSRQDAMHFAQELNQLNVRRQSLTRAQSSLAETIIDPAGYILIAADGEFTSGVVGLVASRLNDLYYRPAVVIEQGSRESRGSCRSIPEFHITHALDQVQDLLVRYGGHAQAAGFTILNENLDAFYERLTAIAVEQLAGQELKPTLEIDAELALHQVDWALHGQLQRLEPTGEANPTPLFISRNLRVVDSRTVGQDNTHLKLRVSDGERDMAAIAFRQGAWRDCMPTHIDLVYTIQSNTWNGQRELQLRAEDIRPAVSTPDLDEQVLPATAV
jgi:single-stranded-DNA-specific exonuclease